MKDKDDNTLLAIYLTGDEAALTELVNRYQKEMYRFVYRLVGNHDDTSDVCQKVFVNLFLKADQYRGGSSFKTWLYQIAINQCKNHYRSNDRQRIDSREVDFESIGGQQDDSLNDYSEREQKQKLEQAVSQLPARQKTTIQLRLNRDLTFKEIAEIMKISVGTAKAHYHQAVTSLKKLVQDDDYEANKV